MSHFWWIALCLSVLAISMILVPLLIATKGRKQVALTNTQIIKNRLAELDQELQEGLLSAEDKAQAVKELKLALVDENQTLHQSGSNMLLPLSMGAFVGLLAGALMYYQVNQLAQLFGWEKALTRLPELGKRVVLEADPTISERDLQEFALGIRSKLIDDPDDYTAWLLLGRLHTSLNRLQSSIDAYEKGLALNPRHPALLSSYSRSLLMTGDESYIRRAIANLQLLVELSPQDLEAHSMLAIAATQLGENELALNSWRTLAAVLPENHTRYQAVMAQIADLEGEGAATYTSEGPQILVDVQLDDALRTKLPEQGYLFVFAQAANGASRMPAAVIKTRLEQLPVQVSLSNANAMIANYTLSQLSEARLVARISADENVAKAIGELEGEILISLEPDGVTQQKITIDKEIL